jgi:hypothetical protein
LSDGRANWSDRLSIFLLAFGRQVAGRSSTDITTSCMIEWMVPQPGGSHVEEAGGGAGLLARSDYLLEKPSSNERAVLINNNGRLLLS